jgi:hypothetical protein
MTDPQHLHQLEQVRVVVSFDKIFEHKHKVGKVRVFCTGCNSDLPADHQIYKIATELVRANISLVAAKEN